MNTPALLSALIYTGISLVAAGTFLVVTLVGDHTWVARAGGAAWVFGLSMIVLMPVVTSTLKKRLGSQR